MKLRPLDFIFIFIFLSLGVWLCVRGAAHRGSVVVVNAAGKQYEYSAAQDGVYEVPGRLGITKFEIKAGRVRITDSPCPNKTCVNQGWHSPVVCLPNDVIITVQDDEKLPRDGKGGFDAISE